MASTSVTISSPLAIRTTPWLTFAVRSGDAHAVPEPSTMLWFGSGLAGLAVWRYKKMQVS